MVKVWDLLIFTVCLVQCSTNNITDDIRPSCDPIWRYKCVPRKGCQRSSRKTINPTAHEFTSIDVCRTTCGRYGSIWPRPITAALSSQTVMIHPNFLKYHLDDAPSKTRDLITQMTHVVTKDLLAECGGNVTKLVVTPVLVHIAVKSERLELAWETNEEYVLDVRTKEGKITVHIAAETVYGARHGLETFTHLVSPDNEQCGPMPKCLLHLISGANVRDHPVYPHRGLMLDTSRHFIPMTDLKRTIDGMAASKLNVFHWHITDAQSFPMESARVPQFALYGAYSPSEIYKAGDIKDLINYAQIRGVRVVIEIDVPAHASNGWQWGKDYGLGDLAVCVTSYHWRRLCKQPPCGQLNPANPEMYRILKELYRDVAEYLQEPTLFHMGGDEVTFACWNTSPEIRTYMKEQGYTLNEDGFLHLWGEFHKKALLLWDEVLVEAGKTKQPVMLWSSELTVADRILEHLDKNRYVIEVWESTDNLMLIELLTMGYRAVSVPKDVWYLDHGFWGSTKYSNWRRMYNHKLPSDPNLLGGEVAMWTEYVDEHVLDTRVWPRAAAVAERLWADPSAGAYAAEPRLQRWRSRAIARGLRPDALSPAWCTQNEFSYPRSQAQKQQTCTSVEWLFLLPCLLLVVQPTVFLLNF